MSGRIYHSGKEGDKASRPQVPGCLSRPVWINPLDIGFLLFMWVELQLGSGEAEVKLDCSLGSRPETRGSILIGGS